MRILSWSTEPEVQRLMTTIGIIGAGEVGRHVARAAIANGYNVVIANSWGKPVNSPGRLALSASSDVPEAIALVTRLYDQFGFDTADNSPLSESWRSAPGQPAWKQERQTRSELAANLAMARHLIVT
jgi:predicted dinucleotide-binding enzyme